MEGESITEKIAIPSGVSVSVNGYLVTAKGPKGEVSRKLPSKKVALSVNGNELHVVAKDATRREKMLLYTFVAHLKNLLRGVESGHTYLLKICSGHFPMNVTVKGAQFEVKNFIGEAVPRRMPITEGADVKIEGDKITVSGIDKELVSQVASRIEKLTKRPGFDNRIFQDGIYLIEKDGRKIE